MQNGLDEIGIVVEAADMGQKSEVYFFCERKKETVTVYIPQKPVFVKCSHTVDDICGENNSFICEPVIFYYIFKFGKDLIINDAYAINKVFLLV